MTTDPKSLLLDQFVTGLETIPWFKRLGEPSVRDIDVLRIYSWQTWPGPENPGATIQAEYHSQWLEELFQSETPPPDDPLTKLWESINDKVMALARINVPYYDEEDPWYGPNAAVWQAAYVAALIGCTLAKHGRLIQVQPKRPSSQWTLENEWWWFQRGHWPCCYFWSWGYTELDAVERTGGPRLLIVY
jgi:hypothetical protein